MSIVSVYFLLLVCLTNWVHTRLVYTIMYPLHIYCIKYYRQKKKKKESEITVNSTIITFMRTSAEGNSPLTSTLVINSVSGALNGTVVHCVDVGTLMAANTTICLFDMCTYP